MDPNHLLQPQLEALRASMTNEDFADFCVMNLSAAAVEALVSASQDSISSLVVNLRDLRFTPTQFAFLLNVVTSTMIQQVGVKPALIAALKVEGTL